MEAGSSLTHILLIKDRLQQGDVNYLWGKDQQSLPSSRYHVAVHLIDQLSGKHNDLKAKNILCDHKLRFLILFPDLCELYKCQRGGSTFFNVCKQLQKNAARIDILIPRLTLCPSVSENRLVHCLVHSHSHHQQIWLLKG